MSEQEKTIILENHSFFETFDLIHRRFDYYRPVVPQRAILNDIPPDVESSSEEASFRFEEDKITPYELPPDRIYSAVFVDSCQSWYGTKQFMRITLPQTPKGSFYIFQDYGACTCFWVPIFLQSFHNNFKLVAFVDHTYTFELTEELSPEMVDQSFPDSPLGLSRSDYEILYKQLLANSILCNDVYTLLNYQLQHAATLAYLGYRDEARAKIVDLLNSPYALTHRGWILSSLNGPTYDPNQNMIDLFL